MGTVRQAKNDYLLAPDEDLPGLRDYSPPVGKLTYHGLTLTEVKIIRTDVFKAIIAHWPNHNLNDKKAEGVTYGLADPCSFWFKVLRQGFEIRLRLWLNTGETADKESCL